MCSFTNNQKENELMPYIPTKAEEARAKKWKTEKERKDNILNTSFDKLTSFVVAAPFALVTFNFITSQLLRLNL